MSKLRCRLLGDEDKAVIRALIREKRQQLGIDFWLPKFEDARTHLVLVFEKDGMVVGAVVFRQVWECILAAAEPAAMVAGVAFTPQIKEVLRREGIDEVLGFVPKKLLKRKRKSGMERLMERIGFRRIDDTIPFEIEV